MSDESLPSERLRAMQIIAFALPMGVVIFLGIVLFLVYGRANAPAPPQQSLPIITIISGVFFLVTGSLSFIVPQFITRAALTQQAAQSEARDANALLGLRQTSMIISIALLEGPAFFALIAFLVEQQPLVLIVPGLALLGMLAQFPTENSVRNWLELNGRRVQEMRQDRT